MPDAICGDDFSDNRFDDIVSLELFLGGYDARHNLLVINAFFVASSVSIISFCFSILADRFRNSSIKSIVSPFLVIIISLLQRTQAVKHGTKKEYADEADDRRKRDHKQDDSYAGNYPCNCEPDNPFFDFHFF